ncbi:hypothetical protein [Thermocrinis sp.]|uniref:hypothetical protein n=1 Tax=Thermocrinis sp. TaxID=2024383 RepID=UPI003C0C5F70
MVNSCKISTPYKSVRIHIIRINTIVAIPTPVYLLLILNNSAFYADILTSEVMTIFSL